MYLVLCITAVEHFRRCHSTPSYWQCLIFILLYLSFSAIDYLSFFGKDIQYLLLHIYGVICDDFNQPGVVNGTTDGDADLEALLI